MKPKILVLTKTIKSYWKSPYAEKRVSLFIESKNSSIISLITAAVKGYRKSSGFDLVICADPRIGVFYGILKNIFHGKTPLIVDQLILSEKSLKDNIYKLALIKANIVIVNSSYEVDYYKKRLSDKINFVFLPIPAEDFWFKKNKKPDNYIFAGGGEKRDFKSLIEIAPQINCPIKIVTFSKIASVPKNCEIIYKVSNQKYIDLIGDSRFVVIPLVKSNKSAGQTTLVQAMCQGKAVVVAKNPGVLDYAKDNCVYYVPEDKNNLLSQINKLLASDKLRQELEEKTSKFAKESFSYEIYDKKMEEIINLCLKS